MDKSSIVVSDTVDAHDVGDFIGSEVEAALGLSVQCLPAGRMVWHAPLTSQVMQPDGAVHGTLLSVLADGVIGTSVFSALNWMVTGPTAELRIDYLGAPGAGARRLEAFGSVLSIGDAVGTARADIRDDLGNPVAHAMGVMVIDKAAPVIWRDHRAGIRARFELQDVCVTRRREGEFVACPTPGMRNISNNVHGGVLMGLVRETQDSFIARDSRDFRMQRLNIDYLRPARLNEELNFRSEYLKVGRRLRSVQTWVSDAGGRLVAVATGSSVMAVPA